MLENTRGRTVFALKHKYSFERVEGDAEATEAAQDQCERVTVKKKSVGGSAATAALVGQALLRSALSDLGTAADEAEGASSEAPLEQPLSLASSGHLAGTLRGSDLRRAAASAASAAPSQRSRLRPEVLSGAVAWAATPVSPLGAAVGTPASELRYASSFVRGVPVTPSCELFNRSTFVPLEGCVLSPAAAGAPRGFLG